MPSITCRPWESSDLPNLLSYLLHLDAETKSRFQPHPFTEPELAKLFADPSYTGFILIENTSTYIIGYAIVKLGYFEHDLLRYQRYSVFPDPSSTAMYAPSLATGWRNKGVGKILWQTIEHDLRQKAVQQVLLWGGVQETNAVAVAYYQRLGFHLLGRFEMNGIQNLDMMKHISI